MAGVMILDTFRQQTFAASLSPTRESGAAALCFHARTKTMLAFACSFRCLIGAFHGTVERTGTVKVTPRLSMFGSSCVAAVFDRRRFVLPRRVRRSEAAATEEIVRDASTALDMTKMALGMTVRS